MARRRQRPSSIESKADAVRSIFAHPRFARWNRKTAREFAVRDWKARIGNLRGRPHPSEAVAWQGWLHITKRRYEKRLQRAGVA